MNGGNCATCGRTQATIGDNAGQLNLAAIKQVYQANLTPSPR
jgi:hypothetical protein